MAQPTTTTPAPTSQDQGKPKQKVDLSGVAETLLLTVYGRAFDAKLKNPLLNDKASLHIYESLDYEWSRLGLDAQGFPGAVTRGLQLDKWAAEFLNEYKDQDVTVLHLACGLDTRNIRLSLWPRVCWVDVDFPNVIELRKRFEDSGLLPRPECDYRHVGASVIEDGWLAGIPNDRPTMVLFEGLSMYLTPEDGAGLIKRVVSPFPKGHLIFDCVNWVFTFLSQFFKFAKVTGSKFGWAINDPKSIETLVPNKNLRLTDRLSQLNLPGVENMPFAFWVVMRVMSVLPVLGKGVCVVRYNFE